MVTKTKVVELVPEYSTNRSLMHEFSLVVGFFLSLVVGFFLSLVIDHTYLLAPYLVLDDYFD